MRRRDVGAEVTTPVRDRDAEQLHAAIATPGLVTVWGPAGVGKTWLVRKHLADATLCRLDGVREPAELGRAVAASHGLPGRAHAHPPILARAAVRRGVLVLDGIDGVLAATIAFVEALVAAEPGLRIVVTARRQLGLGDERSIALGPLERDDALGLWRALVAEGGLASDPSVASALVDGLDRLPAALQWYAPRAILLGERDALARLHEPGSRTDPLTLALDTVLDDLAPNDLALLERIAAFESGASVHALEQAYGAALEAIDVLLARALIRIERGIGPSARIVAYRSVKARVRARAGDRWSRREQEHAQVVLAGLPPWTHDPLAALPGRMAERVELRAIALRSRFDDPASATSAAIALVGPALGDGDAAWLLALLQELAPHAPQPTATALARGALARRLGRLDQARTWLESAAADPGPLRFWALLELAHLDRMQSRTEAALDGYAAALALARAEDDRERESIGLGESGRMLQSIGRLVEARTLHTQAIALQHAAGLDEREALERSLHARATHRMGEVGAAVALHERALAMHRARGDRHLAAAELGHLGFCWHELGELAQAEAALREAIDGLSATGDVTLAAIDRLLLARLLADADRVAEAELELAIAQSAIAELAMPRLALTHDFVAGLLALAKGDRDGALDRFRPWLRAPSMIEVGFEALLPGFAALCVGADANAEARAWIDGAEPTIVRLEHPGLRAAFAVAAAAVRGAPVPAVPNDLRARSSDLRRVLAILERRAEGPGLALDPEGLTVVLPDGAAIDLTRRAAPRRVLLALANGRMQRPGVTIGPEALQAAGWPGEKMSHAAGLKRVRTAIWTLRRLGLESVLRTCDDGYLLDPAVPLRLRRFDPV